MKTKSFIAMSMIAALAAGCSSDDIVDGVENTNGDGAINGNGKAYVSLNITLPSEAGTRSANDVFDHGTANEYKVKTLRVTYYQNEDGTGEPFESKTYTSEDLGWSTPSSPADGITTNAVLPVAEVSFTGDAWALVEINTPAGLGVNPTNNASAVTADMLIGGERKDAFFMTNTVREDGKYLVKVTASKTELLAKENARYNHIFVERAVAKAQLNVNPSWGGSVYAIDHSTSVYHGAQIRIDSWKLDVTNKFMYPIRKFRGITDIDESHKGYDKDNFARFYGVAGEGERAFKRTYWAVDPNYEKDLVSGGIAADFNVISNPADINNAVGGIEYCLENTFNTKHQVQWETTRALVKANFKPNDNIAFGQTWYTMGNSTKAYNHTQISDEVAIALGKSSGEAKLREGLGAGTHILSGSMILIKDGDTFREANGDELEMVQNHLGKVTVYEDGICYYAIRIKHLDNYCLWGDETYGANMAPTIGDTKYVDYTDQSTDETKATMEKNYLGRYGMVRNNWYRITINSVSQPGSPTIPELTSDPDDEQKYYLQATINILDWAVRNQGVDL